ncbi:MAG: dephospho-CoA kinase, partial [Clostridia bacterium]|nr:dephospho-CoA kinase [Clostridia bacterium]
MIVGISGGIGSGKSCVTNILKDCGFKVLDADQLAREVVRKGTPGLAKLVEAFGEDILTKDGRLNRKKTARLCFGNDKNYKKLNKIVGNATADLCKEKLAKYKDKNIALEVILLFEAGWDKMCDKTIAVSADTEVRIKRVIKRDHCTREDAINRI